MPPPTDTHDSSDSLLTAAASSGVAIVSVGEQDFARRDWLSAELNAALETDQPVIVELSQATLIDSTSIAAILQAADRASARAQPFTICAPIGSLPRQVLSLLHVSTRVRLADTLEDAVHQMRHTRSAASTEAHPPSSSR
jgi:anti-anti-sigma regulatory factor